MSDHLQAYVGGMFLPADQAAVPISDAALLQGIGVFETLRTYGGRPFRLQAHLERLRAGAEFLGIRLAESDGDIAAALSRLLEANQAPDARVRITLTAGPMDRAETDRAAPPRSSSRPPGWSRTRPTSTSAGAGGHRLVAGPDARPRAPAQDDVPRAAVPGAACRPPRGAPWRRSS